MRAPETESALRADAPSLLFVNNHRADWQPLIEGLRAKGYRITEAESVEQAQDAFARGNFDVVISDFWLGHYSYATDLIGDMRQHNNRVGKRTELVVWTGAGDIDDPEYLYSSREGSAPIPTHPDDAAELRSHTHRLRRASFPVMVCSTVSARMTGRDLGDEITEALARAVHTSEAYRHWTV
jgi:hypothetical protein